MQITLTVAAGEVRQGLKRLGASIPQVVNDDLRLMLEAARRELSKPGKPVEYPISWDSERQRRAYFATNGFGKGIPYRRTGTYSGNFRLTKTGHAAHRMYTLSNATPYARYVGGTAYGRRQSRIHAGRWPLVAEIVRKYAANLVKNVTASIRGVIQANGFGL